MSKLEEIKEQWKSWIEDDMEAASDVAWLIAEAEKVERLEAENKRLREENEHWHLRISQISEANEVLERTLRERPIIVRVPGSLIEGRK